MADKSRHTSKHFLLNQVVLDTAVVLSSNPKILVTLRERGQVRTSFYITPGEARALGHMLIQQCDYANDQRRSK